MSHSRSSGQSLTTSIPVAERVATTTDRGLAVRLAALASLGASVIHFAVVPSHWHEWIPAGLFFVVLAHFQLLWAPLVLTRPSRPVLAAGIAVNAAAIALWALSRTAGAPVGPNAGEPESVQAAGLCALMLQVYVVMGAAWVWHRGRRGQSVSAVAHATILLGFGGVIAVASTVGVASGLQHDHHSPASAEPDSQEPGVFTYEAVPRTPGASKPAFVAPTEAAPPPHEHSEADHPD